MKKLFIYGSLKRDQYNFGRCGTQRYLRKHTLRGYQLYDTGYGYPYITITVAKNACVQGEVHEVSDSTYARIRALELGEGYKEVTLPKGIVVFVVKGRANVHWNTRKVVENTWKGAR